MFLGMAVQLHHITAHALWRSGCLLAYSHVGLFKHIFPWHHVTDIPLLAAVQIRVMPNTPCLIGQAASAFVMGTHATESDANKAYALMSSVGELALPVSPSWCWLPSNAILCTTSYTKQMYTCLCACMARALMDCPLLMNGPILLLCKPISGPIMRHRQGLGCQPRLHVHARASL